MRDRSHRVWLGILMIVVGSLIIQNNFKEHRMQIEIEKAVEGIEEERHTFDDFYPLAFSIGRSGGYVKVFLTGTNITLFKSRSSSKAVKWAIDNVPRRTSISITETIYMDSGVSFIGNQKKSFAMRADGGYLYFGKLIEQTVSDIYLSGITAVDTTFINSTIHNSTLEHCRFINSTVTDSWVHLSMFDTVNTIIYIEGPLAHFNITADATPFLEWSVP